MQSRILNRRGFLAMVLAAGAVTAISTADAQAFGFTTTTKPAAQGQAVTMQSGTAKHHGSFWSYNTRPTRKDPRPLVQPPRKRPCANRPGHGCR